MSNVGELGAGPVGAGPLALDPVIRIRSGRPTPLELTAVVTALAAATRAAAVAEAQRRQAAPAGTQRSGTGWGAPGHGLRTPLVPGPGAWRQAPGIGGLR